MAETEDTIIEGVIWINPERVSGTPCFLGTRVPVKALWDCVAAGESVDEFLDGFPGVSKEQALRVIELAREGLFEKLDRAA